MSGSNAQHMVPRTEAVRRVLELVHDQAAAADLLFFEEWQMQRHPDIAACLRASQIRRANPQLAAAIHAELTRR